MFRLLLVVPTILLLCAGQPCATQSVRPSPHPGMRSQEPANSTLRWLASPLAGRQWHLEAALTHSERFLKTHDHAQLAGRHWTEGDQKWLGQRRLLVTRLGTTQNPVPPPRPPPPPSTPPPKTPPPQRPPPPFPAFPSPRSPPPRRPPPSPLPSLPPPPPPRPPPPPSAPSPPPARPSPPFLPLNPSLSPPSRPPPRPPPFSPQVPPRLPPPPPVSPLQPPSRPPPPLVQYMYAPDAAILLEARKGWGADSRLSSWGANKPCGQWEGVTCDASGRASKLDLYAVGLSGDIPSSLGNLVGLQYLRLDLNLLTGSLPSSLGNLTGLQYLLISTTQLSGSLPSSIGNLTGLYYLYLAFNQLTGPIPPSFGNLNRLLHLYLYNNRLSGSIPSSFSKLSGLLRLSLSSNRLSGSIPAKLASLTGLQSLFLDANQLSGAIPSKLSKLPRLVSLGLNSNRLSGSLPSSIGSLTKCVFLDISSNQLSGSLPSSIGNLASLKYLFLQFNQLSGSIPSSIGNLTGLVELFLFSNQLSGSLPSSITRLTGFPPESGFKYALDVANNRLTGPVPPIPAANLEQWVFTNNLLSGSCPSSGGAAASVFEGNCFQGCRLGHMRSKEECSFVCGSDNPVGPCSGRGTCYIQGPNSDPTCDCDGVYISPPSNPGSCVLPLPPASVPPPPPQSPPKAVTLGVSFQKQEPTGKALNRWSRYLSSNYKPQNGIPRWSVQTGSFWMAPRNTFLGFSATGSDATGLLQWGGTRDQGACAACWAVATADAVAAAQTIAASSAGGSIPILSVPQVLTCSANGTCAGDFPTTALEYAASSALLNNASFEAGTSCQTISPPPSIVMYETVQFRGWFGLLLTLQKQPALVILEAGAPFQRETCVNTKLVFQDPSCYSGNLNHAVLVVGYDISALYQYWVIRNSWGGSWCNHGYMRLAIQGGNGVCGMNVLPAYYPVAAPPAGDPCYKTSAVPDGDSQPALNPCGGGTCKPAPSWGKYSYTCTCPKDFVPVNNTVKVTLPRAGQGITQTCAPVDACGLKLTNPCSVGTCVNDGKGSYTCMCPIGYYNDTTADGQSTCSIGSAPAQLIVQPGMTCCLISATYNITTQQLLSQNPGLDCSALSPGQVVNTTNPSFSCAVGFTVTSQYNSFEAIAGLMQTSQGSSQGTPEDVTAAQLRALNPTATCSAGLLAKGEVICLKGGTWPEAPTCNKLYTMKAADTCEDVIKAFLSNDPVAFFRMNPGIDCDAVTNPGPGADAALRGTGVSVCVGTEPVGGRRCAPARTRKQRSARTALFVALKGDTCVKVLNKRCKKFKDRRLFSVDAFLKTNRVPDCSDVRGFQFCCPV